MNYEDNQYIEAKDLSFIGILHDTKKAKNALQPIFECFTNALEALKIKQHADNTNKGKIEIEIYAVSTTTPDTEFSSLSMKDNGIGFDDEQFSRFNKFKDTSKGFKNLGSGRLQYVHYFETTTISSVFKKEDAFFERKFIVSKSSGFLDKNAIVRNVFCKISNQTSAWTKVDFRNLLIGSEVFNDLTNIKLKEKLLERYIHYFCHHREQLPEIIIKFFKDTKLADESTITASDIPDKEKSQTIKLNYSIFSNKNIEKVAETEDFKIDGFKIPKGLLKENKLSLVSKGEVIEESEVKLQQLAAGDNVDGMKFLFLVSSNYIDKSDTDLRGELNIPNRETFEKGDFFTNPKEILIEDIQDGVNEAIGKMYPKFEEVKQQHEDNFRKLKEMFLLDDETEKNISFSINDSETEILKKFYEANARKEADIDASIKSSIDKLNLLDTRNPTYAHELELVVDSLVKSIPLQNKKALTQYVARRKMVLELLDKILARQLDVQQNARNDDEALIHNLLFQKHSIDPIASNLWIINEDFIYFKGNSEAPLNEVQINGEKIFKEELHVEEERYLKSLGEKRDIKRPDVLLFPEEGKCIIIEFKAPHINASLHLTQIDRYANLILNFTKDKYNISTFYGYLLGEAIEPRDVRGAVSSFEESYQFDYLFRPSAKVVGEGERKGKDGSIYTEVIKYSTLLERAKQRNRIFIDKLK